MVYFYLRAPENQTKEDMKKTKYLNFMRTLIMSAFISSILTFIVSCNNKNGSEESDISTVGSLVELKKLINTSGNKLLVFDLYADWCGPCRRLSPTISALAAVHRQNASFYKINVDNSPEIASAFGVQGIPYVVFIKNKQTIYSLTGINPSESYGKIITSCGSSESFDSCTDRIQENIDN